MVDTRIQTIPGKGSYEDGRPYYENCLGTRTGFAGKVVADFVFEALLHIVGARSALSANRYEVGGSSSGHPLAKCVRRLKEKRSAKSP